MPDLPAPSLMGLVLAGGRSVRMGRDKSALVLGGQCFLERARLALLKHVYICRISGRGFGYLEDSMPGFGPVAGIARGLMELGGFNGVMVLPCDLPLVTAGLLARLVNAGRQAGTLANIFWNSATGKLEMTCAIYWRESLPFFEQALCANQHKLGQVIPAERIQRVICPPGDAWQLANCNTPRDFQDMQKIMN